MVTLAQNLTRCVPGLERLTSCSRLARPRGSSRTVGEGGVEGLLPFCLAEPPSLPLPLVLRSQAQPVPGPMRHQEALKLLCEEDQTPISVVCDRSRAHRARTVVAIEEAAQEYKEKIQARLKSLREEREKLLRLKVNGEKRSQEYLIQTQAERQKILSEFQQLLQFLEEQERLLLARLEKLEKEIPKIQNDNASKLSEEISCLSNLISEMEGNGQEPASEFLQDLRSTLSRLT
ncbi:unnamed protein product [Caretta caretta]